MSKALLYSTTGCPLCERYRQLLDSKGHPYEERNTTENPGYLEELAARGVSVVPTVVVGDNVVVGFKPNSLVEVL
jgi:glutaredoxin